MPWFFRKKEETVSKASYDNMVSYACDLEMQRDEQANACRSLGKRLAVALAQRDGARSELAALRAEQERRKAKACANLKQFRKPKIAEDRSGTPIA